MGNDHPNNDGIIDASRNPFAVKDWIRQRRRFTMHRRKQAEALLGKTVQEINDLKDRNIGRYPAFVAIRWHFAEIMDDKLVPTGKWNER